VSVRVVARTDGSKKIALLDIYLTSLVVLGHYELCFILGTQPGITGYSP